MSIDEKRMTAAVLSAIAAGICLGLAVSYAIPLVTSTYTAPAVRVQPAVNARLANLGAVPPPAQARILQASPLKAQGLPAGDDAEAPTSGSFSVKWLLAAALPLSIFSIISIYRRWVASFDEDEEDLEELEEEADWVIASTVGNVNLQYTAEVPVKDARGSSAGTTELCLRTAGPNSRYVIHRKLVAEFANRRQANAHTKTRGEVSGGGKKPYKQKGTGNARRGSTRSPLMRHGGVAFGPRNTKNYKQKVNKKEGRLAISSLLQNRAPLITIIKDLENSMEVVSTKKAADMIESWKDQAKGSNVLLIVDVDGKPPANHPLVLSTNNLAKVKLLTQQQVAVADLLWPHQIFISEKALESFKQRFEVPEEAESEASAVV